MYSYSINTSKKRINYFYHCIGIKKLVYKKRIYEEQIKREIETQKLLYSLLQKEKILYHFIHDIMILERSETMKTVILNKLKEIEEKENVKIILAVESGSRAWGFASEDSDYDVRFIYTRTIKDYLKVEGIRDVIEWQLDDVLDINGWDLKKAMHLLHKSNPSLYEWCHSPIIYHSSEEFETLKQLLPQCLSKKKILKHYLSMTKTTYETHLKKDKVKMKKYFYALRPIFAARYIIEKDAFPPIEFDLLLDEVCPPHLKDKILDMVELKKTMNEKDLYPRDDEINHYIEENMTELTKYAEDLELYEVNWDILNEKFLEMIK